MMFFSCWWLRPVRSRLHASTPMGAVARVNRLVWMYRGPMIASVLTDDLNLVGRDAESKVVDTVLDHLGDGGGALIFRGEPGIGKSALLDRARQRARVLHARVLSTVGVEAEAELAFAGLHQLLHPIVGLRDRLSAAQRAALEAAFGVTAALEPDPFRVSVAAFQLLCEAADSRPVVLIVDDA